MNTQKLNNFKVTPVLSNNTNKFVRGSDLIKEPYANIIVAGGKKSGKSNMIYRMMQKLAHRCNVVIFSPTIYNDPTYKKMIKMLKSKNCNVTTHDHIVDQETGLNRVREYRLQFQRDAEDREAQIEAEKHKKLLPKPPKVVTPKFPIVNFGDPPEEEVVIEEKPLIPKKPTKTRPLTPEHIFIFDDLSAIMRDPEVYQLVNKNRHFKMKTITAIHSVTDLKPATWGNVDYVFCFPNLPFEKMMQLKEKTGLCYKNESKDNNVLWNAYQTATKDKYNFLYVDRCENELRKNFSERFILD